MQRHGNQHQRLVGGYRSGDPVAKPIPPLLREPAVPSVFDGPELGVEFASGSQAENPWLQTASGTVLS